MCWIEGPRCRNNHLPDILCVVGISHDLAQDTILTASLTTNSVTTTITRNIFDYVIKRTVGGRCSTRDLYAFLVSFLSDSSFHTYISKDGRQQATKGSSRAKKTPVNQTTSGRRNSKHRNKRLLLSSNIVDLEVQFQF